MTNNQSYLRTLIALNMGKHLGTGVGAKKANKGSGGGAGRQHFHPFLSRKPALYAESCGYLILKYG